MRFKRVCDRCGFEYADHQTRKEWTGLMVCHGAGTSGCWEARHSQDFVRGVKDDPSVPDPRPEQPDTFLEPGDVSPEDL